MSYNLSHRNDANPDGPEWSDHKAALWGDLLRISDELVDEHENLELYVTEKYEYLEGQIDDLVNSIDDVRDLVNDNKSNIGTLAHDVNDIRQLMSAISETIDRIYTRLATLEDRPDGEYGQQTTTTPK